MNVELRTTKLNIVQLGSQAQEAKDKQSSYIIIWLYGIIRLSKQHVKQDFVLADNWSKTNSKTLINVFFHTFPELSDTLWSLV